tara:strand:+ start:2231 stop:2980 length:750 start_codon:yes stop_codon:yes gene_type:complete
MSYLTPNWLMSSFNQMLKTSKEGAKAGYGDILSKSDFRDEYRTGTFNPTFGNTRYYYDYDFNDAGKYHGIDVFGETTGFGTRTGRPEGYRFSSEDDAYKAYVKAATGQSHGDYFSQSDFGTQTANIFDPQSLAEGVARAEGDDPAGVDATGLTAFTPEMLKKLRTEYYQPQIEQERGSLLDSLTSRLKKAQAEIGFGFAGYGGRDMATSVIREKYKSGVEDIYSDIETQKAAGLQDIYDVLSQYETEVS